MKVYHQGQYGFTTLNKKYNKFIPSFGKVLKPYSSILYLETEDNKLNLSTPTIKVVSPNPSSFSLIEKVMRTIKGFKISIKEPNNKVLFEQVGQPLRFMLYKSGGRLQNVFDEDGNALTAKKPTTDQQEDAVRFILESANLPSKAEINKAIRFDFDKDWHSSFEKTFEGIKKEILSISDMKKYEFYRDSNKNKLDFLNKITDPTILPDSKDNWNPSDIWAVKKTEKGRLQTSVNKLYTELKAEKKTIEDLNKFIELELKKKNLIGISLKQITTPRATVKKIVVDKKLMNAMDYQGIFQKYKYFCSNSYFDILFKMKVLKDTVNYRFRFRPRAASGQVKTYGEGQPITQKTFDGAISSDIINMKFPKVREFTNFVNDNLKTESTVYKTITKQTYDKKFSDFIEKGKFNYITIDELTRKLGVYEVKRSVVLLYYIYHFETYSDKKELFKSFYLAAKKMNQFSSQHWKVF